MRFGDSGAQEVSLITTEGQFLKEEELSLKPSQFGILTGFFVKDGQQGVKMKRFM